MILEEETYREFGYYPSNLKRYSKKKVLAACDDCGKVRVTTKTNYHSLCKSCAKSVYANLKDYDWLYQKYHIEQASSTKIAKEIGCTKSNVLHALRQQGIHRRTNAEARQLQESKYIELNDKDWLYQRYWIDEISTHKIGEMIECNHCLVEKALIKFKIGMRTRVKAISGKLSHHWRGGISFLPYCHKFNEKKKEEIREMFGRVCFLCPKTEAENGQKLSVHHIDYNKQQGCDDVEWLLVPLCRSCSTRVNNNRDYWQNLIIEMLKEQGL